MLSRAALVPSTAEHSSWSFLSFQWLVSLVAQMVKNAPAMQETWVQPLDWEDPLEKEMARSLSGGGGKPSFPSPSAGDLRELPRVPLRGEGSCGGGGAPDFPGTT